MICELDGRSGGLAGGWTLLDPDLWSQNVGLPCTLFKKVMYLVFCVCGDVCCANVTVLVVAIGELISLGEPPHTHPTVLVIPLGPVPGILAR